MEPINNWESLFIQLKEADNVFRKEKVREELVFYINHLLLNDFNGLVQLLYRVDVDEAKLKALLQEQPGTDAAVLITDLLFQRWEEKEKTRSAAKKDNGIPDEEKW